MHRRSLKLTALSLLLWLPALWPAPAQQVFVASSSVSQPQDWSSLGEMIRAREAWYAALRPVVAASPAPRPSGTVSASQPVSPVVYEPGSIRQLICSTFVEACRPAVSVARCESTLQPDAVNGPNRGVFQINQVHAARWLAVMGVDYWESWMDPATNIGFAHWLYKQSGWGPWSCKP